MNIATLAKCWPTIVHPETSSTWDSEHLRPQAPEKFDPLKSIFNLLPEEHPLVVFHTTGLLEEF